MINDKIKRYGLFGFLNRLFSYLLSLIGIVYIKSNLYEKLLNDEVFLEESYSIMQLTYHDFEAQSALNPQWFNAEKLESIKKALLLDGNSAYGLFQDKLLIAYGFLSTSYMGLLGNHLLDDDCYLWDAYTHPCARGRRLHKLLTIYRERKAYKMGKKRALVIVDSFNKASKNTYVKHGFYIIQNFYTLSLFGSRNITNFKYGK